MSSYLDCELKTKALAHSEVRPGRKELGVFAVRLEDNPADVVLGLYF